MKNIKKATLLMAGMLSVIACDKDFEEVNTSPNYPTTVTPNLLMAGIIKNTVNDQVNEAWGIGNIVVQHTAKIQFVNEDRYQWGDRAGVWNSVYGNMRNVKAIIDFAEGSNPVQNNYLGIALVMKSWMYSIATDTYGDVPYSKATEGKTLANYTPVYDKQEDIYAGILADLKKANDILGTSTESVTGDPLYENNLTNWKKLANSLRLRYLMRISNREDVKAEMQAIVDNPGTFPIFEGNEDNADIVYLQSSPNQWPLYGSRVGSFDEFRLSKTLGDYLAGINDPRLAVFARPTEKSVANNAPVIAGIPNGLEDTQALDYNGGPQNVSRIGLTFACLVCDDPAPAPNASRGLIMTYAELQFILAEAREKNLITTGDAETYYLNGINANLDYYREIVPERYGIDLTLPADYFTQTEVAYTGSQTEKLRKIGTQKWVALLFNGLEAWFDWRRTNIPALVPAAANVNNDLIPVRYAYPQAEQSLNGKNRSDAVNGQGPDNINTLMWWDK